MNKKNIIIGAIILLILSFFSIKSYLMIEEDQKKYKILREQQKSSKKDQEEPASKQKVFVYSSDYYDIEYPDGSMITKNEVTYHTFDFNNKTVTQNSELNGERFIITYPFKEMYEVKGLIATTHVLKVGTLGLKEIWWSPEVKNLGYDYDDGKRIACYGLKIKAD
ncbi:hypothetical protein [Mesoflavibacter sp. SCSIO 43206]|uniref:hypothetical protein n=1 Tax=Mesoflavibacter sp. SCSIO 43206 TaxID=2779362 RepID=UPI001CA7FFAE|nr:hypothetical protein [Mesoflavibacter sp. SCSIO 43206]UAB74308.1 hypothetical protein INR78_07835 [Mesoflavibacter sp. SCSIO 43206]